MHNIHNDRRSVIIYGNCQADQIARILNQVPAVADHFHFEPVLNHAPLGEAVPEPTPLVDHAVLLWEQYDEREEIAVREAVRKRIPEGCRIVTFPPSVFLGFWPFAWMDPRNVAEPRFPFGRYPWGDRVGHAVAQLGLSHEQSVSRYMELSMAQMPNVERLISRDLELQDRRDGACLVRIADFIREHVRSEHLFWTWGHPSSILLGEIARRLTAASAQVLRVSPERVATQLAQAIELLPGTGTEQLPVHPEVIRQLELSFCSSGTRYRWMGNTWSFDEYMARYISYDTDW
jgi:hypothetical protein